MTAEHLHLALNHIPLIGSACALLPLLAGLLRSNRSLILAGLALAAISGWATPMVMATGEEAAERYEEGPVRIYLDAGAEQALETHEHKAERWVALLYASAAVSTLGFAASLWKPGWARAVATVAAMACIASVAASVAVADTGGKIRRPDFRGATATGLSAPSAAHLDED